MTNLSLEMAPGVIFITKAAQIGLSDERAQAIRDASEITHATAMVWNMVQAQGQRLLHAEPQGRA